jgi:membrane fusion protein, macrolide-specific efflux system
MLKKLGFIFSVLKRFWNKFKRLPFKKKLFVVVLAIILLVVMFQVVKNITKKPGYTTAKAEIGNVEETVTETGTVAASGIINVYSPTNGTVENVLVSNGDTVADGQELFSVVSSATEQESQASYANYLAAKNTLDSAQSDLNSLQADMFGAWDSFKQLAESSKYENSDDTPRTDQRTLPEFHISEKDWLAAEADYKNQQAVISKAQAQVSSTWLLYQATQNARVKAPTDGVVTNLSTTKGTSVSINTTIAPTIPVLTITNSAATEISVALSETDINKVKEGQKTSIKIEAARDKSYNGIVRRVDAIGIDDKGVVRYNTYIELINPDENIRPGMTADVTITTKEVKNALTVPNSAVKPYQGGRAVRVAGKKGEIEYLPVIIGIRGEDKTQIIEGLTEGQEIIISLSNEQIQRPGGLFGG